MHSIERVSSLINFLNSNNEVHFVLTDLCLIVTKVKVKVSQDHLSEHFFLLTQKPKSTCSKCSANIEKVFWCFGLPCKSIRQPLS